MPRKKLATAEAPESAPINNIPAEDNKPKRTRRAPAKSTTEQVEAAPSPTSVETPAAQPAVRKSRAKTATVEAAPVTVSEPDSTLEAAKPSKAGTKKAASKKKPAVTKESAESIVEPVAATPVAKAKKPVATKATPVATVPEKTAKAKPASKTATPALEEKVVKPVAKKPLPLFAKVSTIQPEVPATTKVAAKIPVSLADEAVAAGVDEETIDAPVEMETPVAKPQEAPRSRSRRSDKPTSRTEVSARTAPTPQAEVYEFVEELAYDAEGAVDWAFSNLPVPAWREVTKAPKRTIEPDQATEAESEIANESNSGRRSRRRRGRGNRDRIEAPTDANTDSAEADDREEPEAETPVTDYNAIPFDPDAPREDLVILEFRKPKKRLDAARGAESRRSKPEPVVQESTPESEATVEATSPVREEDSRGRDRGRGRNRRDRGEVRESREVAETATVREARREREIPKAPEKPMIQIPEDAPQVVVRKGVPTLVRNHKVYPPIFFFGSPSDERRADTVFEEVRMAAESGIHLHSFLVEFEVNPNTVNDSASFASYVLTQAVKADPQAQVVFRIVFRAPRGWEDRYPDARYRTVDGEIAEPSVCDDGFWGVAKTCLESFVQKMRLLDLKDHILGLHLERGEWFIAEGLGYDDSRAAQTKFRDWTRTRYRNDEVTLRASWFDGEVRFDNVKIPAFQPDGAEGEQFIRFSRRQRRYVDYHLFLSDITVGRIADLAYAAKAASEGYFLLGVSYGYTFEWSHPASGHLSLGKLLRTPEIDFIAGPPSYRTREPGGSAPFPGPIDSFALNGKLFISEEDFKTSLSVGHEPDDFNPKLGTPQALESVHWRGAGAALAHGSGMAWMDLWGNGWLKTHSVWERAGKVREALTDRLAAPMDNPDVAVFIDERALAYLVDNNAFTLLVQNVRESVLRAGVSAAFYLLSDLEHREKFPESKLYVFLNAWDIRPELRAAIKSRLQRDNKVLFWLYSAGLFDAGRDSLERAREVTGIALKPQPFYSRAGTTILNRRHPLSEAFPNKNVIGGSKLDPSYFAIPEGGTVLGEYSQTGLPSFVVREFNEGPAETHWTSVFLGEPVVNPALIRGLAQMAGAHVWNFQEDVVHVRPPFCTVHCAGAGPRTITLPFKASAFSLLANEWVAVDSPNLRFTAVDGSTHTFLVGSKDEIEQLLRTDRSSLLHLAAIPPRDTNVRRDVSNFDVPIMRLDEWREGSDSDDNADEWFLRPQQIQETPPAPAVEMPDRAGRRRRRRRGRNGNDGPSQDGMESGATRVEADSNDPDFEDFGLSVVFRKKD